MPLARTIALTAAERLTLVPARDHRPLPCARERAAAILKVAAGDSARHVAAGGLLRRRRPEAVGDGVDRSQEWGVVAPVVRPGRGRRPTYARAGLSREPAAAAVLETVPRSPRAVGVDRSRWTRAAPLTALLWLGRLSKSGLRLRRLRASDEFTD
jgi:hypothetical protein